MFWQRFYELCISEGSKPNPVGKQIGISSATITQWKQGAIPSGDTLSKIADYLDCSVDYLLGRTDNPSSHKMQAINTVNSNYNAINNSSVTVSPPTLDEHQKLLLELYNKLSPIEQIELISNLNKQKDKSGN